MNTFSVVILWIASLALAIWGQYWYDRAHRAIDALQFMVEESAEEPDELD